MADTKVFLSGGRIQGKSDDFIVGADVEIVLDDNPSSQYSWGSTSSDYAPCTPSPSNENNYNGVQLLGGSALIGKKVKKIKAWLAKVGSPNTSGTIRLGILSDTNTGSTITWITGAYVDIENLISGESGGVTLPAVGSAAVPIEITLPTPHTLEAYDTIGLACTGGNYASGTNVAWNYSDGNAVYDGQNTTRNRFTGGNWNGSAMTSDMRCTLTCESTVDEKATLVRDATTDATNIGITRVTASGTDLPSTLSSATPYAYDYSGALTSSVGDDYNVVPFDYTNYASFTMSMWIQPDEMAGNAIFRNKGSGSALMELMMYPWSGSYNCKFETNSQSVTTLLTANEWVHLTIVKDGDSIRIYKNGTQSGIDATGVGSGAKAGNGDNWLFNWDHTTDEPYDGNSLQFLVYDTALTTSQIQAIWNSGNGTNTPSTTNLVLWYNFQQATSGKLENKIHETKIPENTLFEETDTYKTYWLQSNEWQPTTPAALNMTYANSTLADADWVTGGTRTTGEGVIKIDTTNNYLKDHWTSTTSTYRLSQNAYDLGSSLGTTFTIQLTARFSDIIDPSSSNYITTFGVYSGDGSVTINTSQDRLAVSLNNSSAYTRWETTGATASGDGSMSNLLSANGTSGSPSLVPSTSTNATDFFVTIQKVDATKYSIIIRTGSHTGTIIGALTDKAWLSGTPSTFRYFGIKSTMSNSVRSGLIVKDVLVYDGVLVGSI